MKHVKWQWNHGNEIENNKIIAVDPKIENKNDNGDKEIGLRIIYETYERLKITESEGSRWKPHQISMKTSWKQENNTNGAQKPNREWVKSDERWQVNEMKNGERETQTYES